ncbi:hypothetical protein [Altericroceibacterium xinjiangense]|uniref:hypothetical protein n=1 Tax=Altericroceibacterium xinjiangense TaxID=762261 RepID=UPI000F7EBF5A|nr:hypothetical protein [Altericroceibacterium xinjiangense]
MSGAPLRVGVLVSHSRSSSDEALVELARQLVQDVQPTLEETTRRPWRFEFGEPIQLSSDERRHSGDFVGEASLRVVEGSFDLVIILTDVALISRRERIVFGLVSPLARTVVLSTHRLRDRKGAGRMPLNSPPVRWNTAALLLHLIGQGLGADPDLESSGAMAPFRYDPDRSSAPAFQDPARLQRLTARFLEHEHKASGPLHDLWIHAGAALRHTRLIGNALRRNRAPLLPLRMPGLATAAVAPVFVLVFSAEFWDAGLGMTDATAWAYAAISILVAACYLCFAQKLFLPRKESRLIPEHLAVANVVIFFSMLLAILGLFVMVALLSLAIELWVFPSDLISTWPTLGEQQVGFLDLLRISVFISTVGVTTGALAGGLQRRRVLRHMALFQAEV